MLFTDISEFKKNIKLELSEPKEKERKNLCFKTGEVFKQITSFENLTVKHLDKNKQKEKYGAWFVSSKNAIFLSKEEIRQFVESKEAVVHNT